MDYDSGKYGAEFRPAAADACVDARLKHMDRISALAALSRMRSFTEEGVDLRIREINAARSPAEQAEPLSLFMLWQLKVFPTCVYEPIRVALIERVKEMKLGTLHLLGINDPDQVVFLNLDRLGEILQQARSKKISPEEICVDPPEVREKGRRYADQQTIEFVIKVCGLLKIDIFNEWSSMTPKNLLKTINLMKSRGYRVARVLKYLRSETYATVGVVYGFLPGAIYSVERESRSITKLDRDKIYSLLIGEGIPTSEVMSVLRSVGNPARSDIKEPTRRKLICSASSHP